MMVYNTAENFNHTYLRDTASESDSLKETFEKAWSALLNNNKSKP